MLIYSIILFLLSAAVNNKRDSSILFSRITILALINSLIVLSINFNVNFINEGLILYGGLFVIKNYILTFIVFTLFISIFIVSINAFYPRYFFIERSNFNVPTTLNKILNRMAYEYRIVEYPLIILFCLTGAVFLMCSYDIISIFLSIELQSYGLYLLCSIYRNSESSINAGLTYFLLGGLSSCIILLGISLLYVNTGNTSLENIFMINSICNAFSNNVLYDINLYSEIYSHFSYIQLPLAIMSVGFLFKIGSAPFHFWSPDVYDAIPTNVTIFVAIIAKISILILLFELAFLNDSNVKNISWLNNIVLSSVLSLIIGSVLGLVQYRIKRLYAYSTISHLGFILLALSINTLESSRAMFFYLIQYSLSNLNAFVILITIGYTLYFYIIKDNIYINKDNFSPIQLISQLKGYFHINPFIAISLSLTLFSFVGVPPLIGFFAKQMILTTAIDKGYIFLTFVAIFTSVISAVYYLVIVKVIYFEENLYTISKNFNSKDITINGFLSFSISIITLFIMLFMFFDYELIKLIYIIS
jgi:NADH-ubiquinone oxidoreductase chain 2